MNGVKRESEGNWGKIKYGGDGFWRFFSGGWVWKYEEEKWEKNILKVEEKILKRLRESIKKVEGKY